MTILSDTRESGVPEETTDEQRDEVVDKARPHAGDAVSIPTRA